MALEVKVFREITAYQARIFFGLPARVAIVGAIALPPCVGLLVAGYIWEVTDILQWVVVVICVVATAMCIQVRGLAMEVFLRYVKAYYASPRVYLYTQEGKKRESARKTSSKERERIALLEQQG